MVTMSKKGLQPELLPTTENSIKYHSYRVLLQILKLLGIKVEETNWGWRKDSDVLVPIMTDQVISLVTDNKYFIFLPFHFLLFY